MPCDACAERPESQRLMSESRPSRLLLALGVLSLLVACGGSRDPVCGNNVVDSNETCDDGNVNPADGCNTCVATEWVAEPLVGGNVPGTSVGLINPHGVALDVNGNIYFADQGNDRIRRIDPSTGAITTVAGTGVTGYSGDGGVATAARLSRPQGVAVDDDRNRRRQVAPHAVRRSGRIARPARRAVGAVGPQRQHEQFGQRRRGPLRRRVEEPDRLDVVAQELDPGRTGMHRREHVDDAAANAPTAEALMRSRYTAYTLGREAYLLATWQEVTRPAALDLADELVAVDEEHERTMFAHTIDRLEAQGLVKRLAAMERSDNIKGIALSGHGMDSDVQASRDAGFRLHLTKPVDIQTLESAISRVCGQGSPPPR